MKRFPWVIFSVLIIVISSMLPLPFTEAAQAETGKSPLEGLINGADSVVVGTVVEHRSYWNDEHTGIYTSVVLAEDGEDEPCNECQQYQAEDELKYPVMRPSPETLISWMERDRGLPEAYISPQIQYQLEQLPETDGVPFSLLGHLQYTPAERNQGKCGNCWAWAGTGVMEIALDVQNGIKDRLSIQYLNSNYNGGSGNDWACCGGSLPGLADFYTSTGKAIPWSNTNAHWQDGGRRCDYLSTTVPAGDISTTPYYPITSITAQTITTQGVSEATAIANIKNILNQDKAIYFSFRLADNTDWSVFQSFWATQGEGVIWDLDPYCGHTWVFGEGGGHAVLCVGYNDEAGTANDYWTMLNSWGTTTGRPDGLFRLDMHMNYDCQLWMPDPYNVWLGSYSWQILAMTYPPNTPSDLTATAVSSSQINLFWQDNSSDETGFKIERKTGSGSYSQIATVGAGVTSYSNTSLSAGTTYYYRVRAYNAAGNSDYSNEASATTLPPPPSAPTLKSPASASTVSSLTPRLEWNASSGAVSYEVQVSTSSSFTSLVVNETGITDLYYDIVPGILNWSTTYYWRVNARNSFGSTSSWSSSWYFKTAIGPPSNLIATTISSSQINLTWQDNSSDETGFKIERKTGSGSYSQIATVGAGVVSYSNTLLSASTTYYYRVRAYNAAGNSAYSNEASATTLPPPPSAPTLKSPASASTVPSLTPRLEWNASSGAVSYGIQISTSSSFANLVVNETGITNLYYDVAPGILNWSTTYYWRVNARDNFGSTSTWSNYWYFKTALGPPPNAPSDLIATPISSSQINLSWQDNSGDETGFKIERKTSSGSYSQIATVGAGVTSYSNSGLSAGTTYYYRVRAYNAVGNSDYSNEASATTLPPPPSAPTLKSPASASTVPSLTPRLEWNASSGAVSYGVQVSTSSSFASLLVNETGITNLYYDPAPGILNWNTTYYWRVNAKNSFGSTSSWSTSRYFKTAVGPPPNAPSDLIATPISSSRIDLSWQDNSSDETGFKIERKTGSSSYSQIATVGAGVTSYSNSRLSASTEYYYRVRAYKGTLNSDYCEEASATTLPPPPSAPTLKSPVSASTVPSLTPRLEWNASSGAVSYGVQVSTSSSFSNLLVNESGITDLFYDIAPGILNWNTTYYWRVNATNSYDSTSSWSTSHYFKTAVGPPPNAPSDLIATTISSSQINLTWQDNSSDETGFKIERKAGTGSYSQIATVGAGVTSYSNTFLSAGTTYYYRVRAYKGTLNSDYCEEASATTLPPPPSAPTLKSPASASTVPSLTPRLEWNASSGAVSYGVQVSTSSSFTNLLVNETGITDLFYDIAPGILNWNTTYYWRVNARNSFGSTSSWSSYRYFRTAVGP